VKLCIFELLPGLTCVSNANTKDHREEERDTLKLGGLPRHVFGGDMAVVMGQLPVADVELPALGGEHRGVGRVSCRVHIWNVARAKLKTN